MQTLGFNLFCSYRNKRGFRKGERVWVCRPNRGRVAKLCVEKRRVRPLAELGWGFARKFLTQERVVNNLFSNNDFSPFISRAKPGGLFSLFILVNWYILTGVSKDWGSNEVLNWFMITNIVYQQCAVKEVLFTLLYPKREKRASVLCGCNTCKAIL